MARKKRTNRSPEFKAKVALAALQDRQTVQQLATLYGVHPTQIQQWKKQLFSGAAGVFVNGVSAETAQSATLVNELFEQIGRLNMELEWLKKKVSGLG
jgi:transposase-like protein